MSSAQREQINSAYTHTRTLSLPTFKWVEWFVYLFWVEWEMSTALTEWTKILLPQSYIFAFVFSYHITRRARERKRKFSAEFVFFFVRSLAWHLHSPTKRNSLSYILTLFSHPKWQKGEKRFPRQIWMFCISAFFASPLRKKNTELKNIHI